MSLILFFNFISCKENDNKVIYALSQNLDESIKQNNSENNINLYDLIGVNINSIEFIEYSKYLGEYEIRDFTDSLKDYVYENDGVQFRTDIKGEIEVIFCFNYKTESWKPKSFKGKLPFELTFSDTFDEIKGKIGEENLFNSNGFYGRIFTWEIEENYKIAIELRLPKENEKRIFIEMVSLSKNNK